MEQIKQSFKFAIKYTEDLERKNALLIQTIKDILNEDDIKELPAYTLLHRTYSQILNGQLRQETKHEPSEKSKSCEMYDPLHAPPNARGKKPSFTVLKSEPEIKSQNETEVKHYSSQALNVDVCLLSNVQKPKVEMLKKLIPKPTDPKPTDFKPTDFKPTDFKPTDPKPTDFKIKVKVKEEANVKEIKIQSKQDDYIYKIEIEGIVYLKHENYLYDILTKKRVANIENNYFKFINKKEKAIGDHSSTIKLHKVDGFSEYYSTEINKGTIYILLNSSVAQSVGEFNDNEIELWV